MKKIQGKILCQTFLLSLLISCNSPEKSTNVSAVIDIAGPKKSLPHFWKSTGYTPAHITTLPGMKYTAWYLSTLRNHAVTYIRPHYLLNLVGTRNLNTEIPEYNWSALDSCLDILVEQEFKLIFELMGNPSTGWEPMQATYDKAYQGQKNKKQGYFTDFTDDNQLNTYKKLITALATHLIERYGAKTMNSWYFETTNEPDLKHFWPDDVNAFLNYYDACSEGLKAADPTIRFGGPGTARGMDSETFKQFLAHCDTGTNYFTGEKGVRLDFISVHRKFKVPEMIQQEARIVNYIREHHPRFANLPFINDEADPLAGWSNPYIWRPGPWYASFVAASVDYHLTYLIDSLGTNYELLSNDNGFLGGWYHRTHFTRFIEGEEEQSNPSPNLYLVKKPVASVMSMLSSLGDTRLSMQLNTELMEGSGILPSYHEKNGQIAILLYHNPDIDLKNADSSLLGNTSPPGISQNLRLRINGLLGKSYSMATWVLDYQHGNPYKIWQEMGRPEIPDNLLIRKMKQFEHPVLTGQQTQIKPNRKSLDIEVELYASSVVLIILNETRGYPTGKFETIDYYLAPGLNQDNQVFLRWQAENSDDILAYTLQMADEHKGSFQPVTASPVIDEGINAVIPERFNLPVHLIIEAHGYNGEIIARSDTLILQ